jgi:hypothetical protein
VSGPWTLPEALALGPQVAYHCNKMPDPVHVLVDLSQTDIVPTQILQLRKSVQFTHPNIHCIAYVGNLTQRIFSETLHRLAHSTRNRYFTTEDEAIAYLRGVIWAEQLAEPGLNGM